MTLYQAVRSLRRSPGFTAVALVCLGLGLGVNTGLFSLLNATLLRPLPFADVDRLVDVHEDNPRELCQGCAVGASFSTFRAWRAVRSFERIDGYLEQPVSLVTGGAPAERVAGALVSAGLFETLGVAPVVGRGFGPDDDRPGAVPVVVLSHRLWTTRFGADQGVAGRTVRINGETHTIVGVMPSRFGLPEFAQLWSPIAGRLDQQAQDDRSLGVVARLAPGATRAQADAEVAAISQVLDQERGGRPGGWTGRTGSLERPLADTGANTGFALALAAAGFVLLIACANLANLMLARGATRSRETAVRVALGAARSDLIRAQLTESLVLALAGGAIGVLAGQWLVQAVVAAIGSEIPVWIDLSFDWRVYGFGLALAVITGLLVGVAPAVAATRTDVQQTLKNGLTTTVGRRENRLRNGLAVTQISLALVLLIGTGLVVKSFLVARRIDGTGFDPRGTLQAEVRLLERRYEDPSRVRAFAEGALERLAELPGVSGAAVSHMEFLGTFVGSGSRIYLGDDAEPAPAERAARFGYAISPDYFAVQRMALKRGRGILASDRPGTPAVAVVNEAAADRMWPAEDPIGKRFRIDSGEVGVGYTVVGVVGNIVNTLGRTPPALVYLAFAQHPDRPLTLQARTTSDPTGHLSGFAAAVREVDPDQPLERLMTGEAYLATTVAPIRFMMTVMGGLGVLALVLAAFGLYGVLAYLVARRTKEIGIRMALGANRTKLVRLVVGRGARLVAVATAIGLPLAFGATGLLRAVLFTVSPSDPAVYLATPALLGLVAMLACYLPARRATRVDPVDALRAD